MVFYDRQDLEARAADLVKLLTTIGSGAYLRSCQQRFESSSPKGETADCVSTDDIIVLTTWFGDSLVSVSVGAAIKRAPALGSGL